MELTITPQAIAWYKEELHLKEGDSLKISGKYGGATNVHVGFSTGIEKTTPHQVNYETVLEGITFFTEQGDDWFFADYNLSITLDDKLNEPVYTYH